MLKQKTNCVNIFKHYIFFRGIGKDLLIVTRKWENELETSAEGLHNIHSMSLCITIDTKTYLWIENLLSLFWNCNFFHDVWFAVEQLFFNDLWYNSTIECTGNNSWNIQKLHYIYRESYLVQCIIHNIYKCECIGKITHLQKTYNIELLKPHLLILRNIFLILVLFLKSFVK